MRIPSYPTPTLTSAILYKNLKSFESVTGYLYINSLCLGKKEDLNPFWVLIPIEVRATSDVSRKRQKKELTAECVSGVI